MNRFDEMVAIVTGGSRGIGKSIAMSLAVEGAKIVLFDIDEKTLMETTNEMRKQGYQVLAELVDIVDSKQVNNAVESVVNHFEKIDILVNNAGVVRDNLLFKMSDEDWQAVLDIHLKGSFNAARACQKYMVDQGFGRIVNISSSSALGRRGQSNYAAAKAGIQGFTKSLAIELGKYGITTNAIAPGFIETEMTKATAERMGITFEEFAREVIKDIPVKRSGQPKDIAHAVTFFCDKNSSFVNGQILYVAGGPLN